MSVINWAVLLITATLFGSSFFVIKLTVEVVTPLTLAAGRAAVAAVAVHLVMRLLSQRLPKLGNAWLPIIWLGLLTAVVPYVAIAWGQQHIDSSLGGILFATIPVFSVFLAPLFLKEERFNTNRFAGVAIGLLGVALAVGPQTHMSLVPQLLGAGATVIAALSYATGNIYARTQEHLSPVVMAAGQLVIAAVILIPVSLIVDAPWRLAPSTADLANIAVIGLLNTAVPVVLMFWLVRNAGASNASLLAFFMPVAAVFLGVLVLGEEPSWLTIAGFSLILIGATLVTGNLTLRHRRAASNA